MAQALRNAVEQAQGSSLGESLSTLGMATPQRRFIVGTALGAIIVWAVRPSVAFNERGEAKDSVFTGDPHGDNTSLPWYALAAIPGVLMAVFL